MAGPAGTLGVERVRIPFPERVPIDRVVIFGLVLFVIQSVEGTAFYFSAGCLAFLILAAIAFNTAGGLTRASGAYVCFFAMLDFIVGIVYKAVLGEPAQSNLLDPKSTIKVYVGGMLAMLAAVVVSHRFTRKSGLMQGVLKDRTMYRAAIGCLLFGYGGPFLVGLLGQRGAGLQSALAQLNQLIPLAIIIGVIYEIRRSGGTRSVSAPVAVAAFILFFVYGILGFSKQGLIEPVVCWLLPVCALRYRLSPLQIAGGLLGLFLLFQYLVPYSQYGRRFVHDNMTNSERMDVAMRLLEHPQKTREQYELGQEEGYIGFHYYNRAEGFWDRLNFVATDDGLINITDQGSEFGLLPVTATFLNAVPRFIWHNKPSYNFGNQYAHEIGGISEDDNSTGISFSPVAEAYHMKRWVGIFVVAPLVWGLLFIVYDLLFGDLRTTPWGLLVLTALAHVAPEQALSGAIYMVTFGTAAFVFCAFFAAYVAPLFAVAALGRDRRAVKAQIGSRPALRPSDPPTPAPAQ
jgi:hypothetical protein